MLPAGVRTLADAAAAEAASRAFLAATSVGSGSGMLEARVPAAVRARRAAYALLLASTLAPRPFRATNLPLAASLFRAATLRDPALSNEAARAALAVEALLHPRRAASPARDRAAARLWTRGYHTRRVRRRGLWRRQARRRDVGGDARDTGRPRRRGGTRRQRRTSRAKRRRERRTTTPRRATTPRRRRAARLFPRRSLRRNAATRNGRSRPNASLRLPRRLEARRRRSVRRRRERAFRSRAFRSRAFPNRRRPRGAPRGRERRPSLNRRRSRSRSGRPPRRRLPRRRRRRRKPRRRRRRRRKPRRRLRNRNPSGSGSDRGSPLWRSRFQKATATGSFPRSSTSDASLCVPLALSRTRRR